MNIDIAEIVKNIRADKKYQPYLWVTFSLVILLTVYLAQPSLFNFLLKNRQTPVTESPVNNVSNTAKEKQKDSLPEYGRILSRNVIDKNNLNLSFLSPFQAEIHSPVDSYPYNSYKVYPTSSLNILGSNGEILNITMFDTRNSGGRGVGLDLVKDSQVIKLSNIGENNYSFIDLFGNDVNLEYASYLKNKLYSFEFLTYPNETKVVFSSFDNPTLKNDLTITDQQGNIIDYINDERIASGNFIGTLIVGWAGDPNYFYVTNSSYEGINIAEVLRINKNTKEIKKINSITSVPVGELSVLSSLDLAVGIEQGLIGDDSDLFNKDLCFFSMGGTAQCPPSKINVYDLKSDTFKTILTSSDKVFSRPVLSPSGDKIFYYVGVRNSEIYPPLFVINIDGSGNKKIGDNVDIESMSYDGNKIIIKADDDKHYLLDVNTDSKKEIDFDELKFNSTDSVRVDFLKCPYPLGFSCLYK